MSSNIFVAAPQIVLEHDLVQRWTCFEALFLDNKSQPSRRAIQITLPFKTKAVLNTFTWQKAMQRFHGCVYQAPDDYLKDIKKLLPENSQVKFLSQSELELRFECPGEGEVLIPSLRFICPQSSQPFFGHLKYSNCQDDLIRWALLQIRSESLAPYQVADRVAEILKQENLQLSWALSRRGGISYQATTYEQQYQRSVVE